MTLTYDCVSQNWSSCKGMEVGATIVIVEPIANGGKVLEVKRMTEEYCKVREVVKGVF